MTGIRFTFKRLQGTVTEFEIRDSRPIYHSELGYGRWAIHERGGEVCLSGWSQCIMYLWQLTNQKPRISLPIL